MDTSAFVVIGLTCNVVGVFFLANSIRFREPRKALEETLGVALRGLDKAQDTALNAVQVVIGFLFLTVGFLLQVVGHWTGELLTILLCGGIIAFAVAVYGVGAYFTRRAFKKLLREFFQANRNWSFTENMEMTKEIGALLGVPHSPDMTVETYVHQVRQALGMTAPSTKMPASADRARRIALPR